MHGIGLSAQLPKLIGESGAFIQDLRLCRVAGMCLCPSLPYSVPRAPPCCGVRDDGSAKIRPVNHFSWSTEGRAKKRMKKGSINGVTEVPETVRHETTTT